MRLRDESITRRVARTTAKHGMDAERYQLGAETIIHLLKAYNSLFEKLSHYFAMHGLSVAKFNLLMVVWTSDEGSLPMSEASERMSVTGANITKLMDGLEADGLAIRARKPGDRRVVLAELTPKGREIIDRILPEYQAMTCRALGELTAEEMKEMIHLCMKFRASVGRAAQSCPQAVIAEQSDLQAHEH